MAILRFRSIAPLIALVVVMAACGGDGSDQLQIDSALNDDFSSGTFTSSGDAGFCESGDLRTLTFDFTETLWTFRDRYTCADGSGTFDMSTRVPLDPDAEEDPVSLTGTWTLEGGTGDYVGYTGSGTFTSFFESATERYTGEVSNE